MIEQLNQELENEKQKCIELNAKFMSVEFMEVEAAALKDKVKKLE